MEYIESFYEKISREISIFNFEQSVKFGKEDILTIDLHCHDYNSSEPDEVVGRMMNIPETWLPSEDLINTLKNHNCDTFTITNHNNARSCYEMQDKGEDILTAAEFSCKVPDFDVRIHVLAYGFSPEQEVKLDKYRPDVYRFQKYALENNIATIWAHPLYHYKKNGTIPMDFFDKMSLVFDRFEVINGQRDSWQNMLVKYWVESMTEENIRKYEKKFQIQESDFCRNRYKKSMFGGSDSHMGIFAGMTGTKLYVKNLESELVKRKRSELALEAILNGYSAPYGGYNNTEKMTITFLDYFCQIGINMEDPGLLRLLLHKGDSRDKMLSFALVNAFSELQRHGLTLKFLTLFHECLRGKTPGFVQKLMVPAAYKTVFNEAVSMADVKKNKPEEMVESFDNSIYKIYSSLFELMIKRLNSKIEGFKDNPSFNPENIDALIGGLEIPGQMRRLFEKENGSKKKGVTNVNMSEFLDGLTFPFLASSVILGANFASTNVMYKSRDMLTMFSKRLNRLKFPERMLWLSDTYGDSNGVSMFLSHTLKEIQKRDLPIDILVCSDKIEPQKNLIVVKPVAEYTPPFYEHQPIRIPNILDIHKEFSKGEYDRILCSTEGPMGFAAFFLKNSYSVPAYFYVHTDWMTFAKTSFNLSTAAMNRMRRIIRAFYNSFDGIFVLNREQRKWLTSPEMGFKRNRVKITSHWVDEDFYKRDVSKKDVFGIDNNTPVLLYVGRISEEKGVLELPYIYGKAKESVPDLKLVIAGKGPDEEKLKKSMPDALFLGWVDHAKLPEIYSAADMLILPSKFDTFGNVIIEAFSCACPVVSYNTKGPRDLIENEKNGFLVNTMEKMAEVISRFFSDKNLMMELSEGAIIRSGDFSADTIMKQLLADTGLK